MDESLSTAVAVARRRRHSLEFKREVVRESMQPDASIASVALSHGINANLLHTWRWKYRCGNLGALPTAQILFPVQVTTPTMRARAQVPKVANAGEPRPAAIAGHIEIIFDEIRVLVHGTPDSQVLRCVLDAVRS